MYKFGELNTMNATISKEIMRATNVLKKYADMESMYNNTLQELINNEHAIQIKYNKAREQAQIEENKRQERAATLTIEYKNYFTSVENKLHHNTRYAMLRNIKSSNENNLSMQNEYLERWKKLDGIEIKRRESANNFYVHTREQFITSLNNIIYAESQAKEIFINALNNLEKRQN